MPPEPAAASGRPDKVLAALDDIAQQPAELREQWRTATSENFTLYHNTGDSLARKLLELAERKRNIQLRFWQQDTARPWRPRCTIHLYPSLRQMQRAGRGKHFAAFAKARSSRLTRGVMLKRQIHLNYRDRWLVKDTLAHELSHVILAELMTGQHVPRWANEGMATLWESPRSLRRRRARAVRALNGGRVFEMHALLRMTSYPASRLAKSVYYAQGMTLVELLIKLRGAPAFLKLLRYISPRNYLGRTPHLATLTDGFARHHDISTLADLTRRWMSYVRSLGKRTGNSSR